MSSKIEKMKKLYYTNALKEKPPKGGYLELFSKNELSHILGIPKYTSNKGQTKETKEKVKMELQKYNNTN
jgi:hypothetical protein